VDAPAAPIAGPFALPNAALPATITNLNQMLQHKLNEWQKFKKRQKSGSFAHNSGFRSMLQGGTSTYRPLCVFSPKA
jgi:hypothetical protein